MSGCKETEHGTFSYEPNRRQGYLLAVDMTDWVADTDIVHLISDVLERMVLSTFKVPVEPVCLALHHR